VDEIITLQNRKVYKGGLVRCGMKVTLRLWSISVGSPGGLTREHLEWHVYVGEILSTVESPQPLNNWRPMPTNIQNGKNKMQKLWKGN